MHDAKNPVILNMAKLTLVIVAASALAESSRGDTIVNYTGGDTSNVPCYMLNVTVPGPDNHMESEFFPVSGNLDGLDPRGVGFGSVFAVANFGSVSSSPPADIISSTWPVRPNRMAPRGSANCLLG
jgi:hypothetical protein